MSKKLSVAIPTYNRVVYLKECIQSVLNQTFEDFSVFVFDNASDESVEEELKKFADDRIHFIRNDKNAGEEGHLNRILGYPFESEYLVMFHDDDAMHPKMLEMETSFLDAHNDAVFVGTDFKRVFAKDLHVFADIAEEAVRYAVYKDSTAFVRAEMSWVRCSFSSVMYCVKAIGDARMNPKRFSDFADIALLAEISRKGVTAFIEVPLMNYRIHAGQYSELQKEGYEQGALELLSFFRESFPAVLSREDDKLFRSYSLNFLFRTYAHMGKSFFAFLKFFQKCRQQKVIAWSDIRHIDRRGAVSLSSIILGNRKVIDIARWLRNRFRS
ncbi:MAG TPA: glycosyltransferase family 2 protein [Candidatus Paceibacterota bacterium]